MSPLLTLTQREISDRRPLLWGTLVAALLPLLARVLPGIRPEQARAFHEGLAAIFAVVFPAALALGLGASVVGEDLAQRRLGFYFSRPISGWSIWASKMLAATFVTLAAWVCFVMPAFLLSRGRGPIILPEPEWFLPWTGGLLAAILVAQAVSGAYRSRDGLFAIDIAAFSVLVALAAAQVWQLVEAGAVTTPWLMLAPALAMVVVAAAVGGAAQVIVGRTDSRRGHLMLSSCLWGTLFVGLLGGLGFSAWVLSVKPDQVGVESWSVRTTPSASHVAFGAGQERAGYRPYFLLDTATGRFQRLPWWPRLRGFAFSGDGRSAVWIEGGSTPMLVTIRLDGSATARRSALQRYADPLLARVSDDGRLAVVALPDRVAVIETDSGREVATASAGQLSDDPRSLGLVSRYEFAGDTVVAFVRSPTVDASLSVSTFEFRTGTVRRGPVVGGANWVRAVRDGRALVSGRSLPGSSQPVPPLDLVDGQVIRPLLVGNVKAASATLLEDGRTAAIVFRDHDPHLMVWSREGQPLLDRALPVGATFLAGEPRLGWICVGYDALIEGRLRTAFAAIADGSIVREEPGLLPAAGPGWNQDQTLPAGSPGSRLFVGAHGELVRLDPETGRREALLVPPIPGGGKPQW